MGMNIRSPLLVGLVLAFLTFAACDIESGYKGIQEWDEQNNYLGGDTTDWVSDGFLTAHCFPNPATDHTNLLLAIQNHAVITIFVMSRPTALVRTLMQDWPREPGHHMVRWALNDDHGQPLPHGIYRVFVEAVEPDSTFHSIYGDVQIGPGN